MNKNAPLCIKFLKLFHDNQIFLNEISKSSKNKNKNEEIINKNFFIYIYLK